MIPLIAELVTSMIGVGKELIVDKDKQIEFAFKLQEQHAALTEKLLTMQTSPKVDAFVKIMYAIQEVVLPLLRPVGSAAMTAFGVYAHTHNVQIDPAIQYIFDGAFPGWMTSRHFNKQKELDRPVVGEPESP
jgi:hypothetical protein